MSIFDLFRKKKKIDAPWEKYYTKEQLNYVVPDISIYDQVLNSYKKYPDNVAVEYLGRKFNYKHFINKIDIAARGFNSLGIKHGDIVTILYQMFQKL